MNNKKHEYWNHWIEYIFVSNRAGKPNGATGARLEKTKPIVFVDDDFWFDIFYRHECHGLSLEQFSEIYPELYDHMIGNFSGMVMAIMRDSL